MAIASRRPLRLTVTVLLALALHPTIGAQEPREVREPLPTVAPASVGFKEERLARLDARMKRFVDEGQHAGIVMLLARKGRIVDWRTWGQRDVARQLPMEKDTIFRIYSMSKVITSVAVMTLHEEGRIKLDDPVAKYLPALKAVKVFKGGTAAAPVLAPARTPITIKHLLTHTSGFIYGFDNEPLDKIYNSSKIFDARSMDEFVTQAAKLPLAHEPGTRFSYGINTDILGAVVEKVSGKKFEDFVEERICGPLGMRDTGFDVPPDKIEPTRDRVRTCEARRWREVDQRKWRRHPIGTVRGVQPDRLLLCRERPGLRGRRIRHVLHDRGLRPLRADAAERRRAGWRADPRAEDGRADDGQPSQPSSARDARVQRLRRVWPGCGGAARRGQEQ